MAAPRFVHSIRFRLTVLYSTLLFLLAGAALVVTYIAVERSTDPHPITKRYQADVFKEKDDGREVRVGTMEVAEVEQVESEVNLRTLEAMRNYSAVALGGLFVASLGIGWVLSGRALRPVRSISRTAQEIQATDLSRRIELRGTRDELRDLADTIDSMLERLDKAFHDQRQLIDDASHELRTPLAIIRANVDASLKSADAGPSERERAVLIIDRATQRMSQLVEDLLATARRNAGALADADVEPDAVAREAGEDFGVLAAERHIGLRYVLGSGLVMIGDRDALRRAVGNLLSNAVRLSPSGGTITVGAGRVEHWLWLAVADEGPGLADEDRTRVSDRFWRGTGDPAGAPGPSDRRTGLGLAIVRQIVESHGGRVTVFSDLGNGSTFVLWFPARDSTATTAPPQHNPLAPD